MSFVLDTRLAKNYISGTYVPLDLFVLNVACVRFFLAWPYLGLRSST